MVFCLHCPNTSMQKWNASVPPLLLSPLKPLFYLVTEHPLLPGWERESMLRDETNLQLRKRQRLLPSSNKEKINIIFLQLIAPKIVFHLVLLGKANWKFVVTPINPHQIYITVSNKWTSRYIEQEKRIIFQRGLLDWLLPSVCEIHEKIQIVYEQLTCNWVK